MGNNTIDSSNYKDYSGQRPVGNLTDMFPKRLQHLEIDESGQVVKLIKKLTKNKHYNFLETLAEDVFDVLFKDKRIGKIMLQIEKLEILKECTSVGIQITKKRSHEKL